MHYFKKIPIFEVSFEASRSGGSGGQHVNKTSSKITLRWKVQESTVLDETEKARIAEKLASRINKEGELVLHTETHKSQHRNKQDAYDFLNSLINSALKVQKKRKKTKPSKTAIERRLRDKTFQKRKKLLRKLGE